MDRDLRWGPLLASGALSAGLLAWNNAVLPRRRWDSRRRAAANGLLGLALLGAARAGGLSWDELGLERRSAGRGLRCGAAAATLPAAAIAAATAWRSAHLPSTRVPSAGMSGAQVAGGRMSGRALAEWTLFAIPVGTVLCEELAFRAVLDGLLARTGDQRAALLGAAVFGLWHVRPARGSGDPVLLTVMFTTGAGLLFTWLRRASGSVLAPAVLHYAVNAMGAIASSRGLGAPRVG
jgi:membrane protease YdiL (CAAX protease family)